MADIGKMRHDIYHTYASQTWHDRVKRMRDAQVIAVWHRFLADGKFDKPHVQNKNLHSKEEPPIFEACYGEQLSLIL